MFRQLSSPIQRAVVVSGYQDPTPIQEQSIRPLLEGRDLLGIAQTGTGKTAAFTLPLLQRISGMKRYDRDPLALVLAPTRELAAQIGASIETYSRFLRVHHTVIFGGVSQSKQVSALRRGVDIVVATPGRLLDLMQQGLLSLASIQFFVLDEVDRMLDMGFINDINRVVKQIPIDRQSLFFSATMPPEVSNLAAGLVRDPVRIDVSPAEPAVERIVQSCLFVEREKKPDLLTALLWNRGMGKVIVFVKMKYLADRIAKKLDRSKIRAAAIHGNKSQGARTRALDGFRSGKVDVLVATDIAARGIDVDGISHVVNYDLPDEPETYVHRIGRTARAEADGEAVSFCSSDEVWNLADIEKLLDKRIRVDTDHEFHSDKIAAEARNPGKPKKKGRSGSGGGPPQRSGQQRRSSHAPRKSSQNQSSRGGKSAQKRPRRR